MNKHPPTFFKVFRHLRCMRVQQQVQPSQQQLAEPFAPQRAARRRRVLRTARG